MVLLAACAVIFIMHEAYAQQQLAEPAVNENINAELNSNGIAYITHEVFNKQLDSPVALIDGTVSVDTCYGYWKVMLLNTHFLILMEQYLYDDGR